MNVERLDWDSNFFNCRVGRLILDADEEVPITRLNDFDFAYLIFPGNLLPQKKKYFGSKFFFADEKLTYGKEITHISKPTDSVLSWPSDREIIKDLLDIGVQSGEYSRFRIDPKIPTQKFIELYENWIINSVKRLIAEEVFYFSINDQVGGIITLSIKNGAADIGILSVNETFRGRGIATELVHAAEYWAKDTKGKDLIQVVTQAANTIACRFYEKCGFRIQKKEYVFHWWRENNKHVEDSF